MDYTISGCAQVLCQVLVRTAEFDCKYNNITLDVCGFEANGVEVQLHIDVRMRQKAGTQTTKIKSAKSFVEVHLRKFIPSKYTRYTHGYDNSNKIIFYLNFPLHTHTHRFSPYW